MGLRARLEVFIIAAFLPLVALVVSLFLQQRDADIEHARQRVLTLAAQGASQQAEIMTRVRGTLQTLAMIPEIRRYQSEDCGITLRRIMPFQPWSTGFALATPDGHIWCRSGMNASHARTVADQGYFRQALASKAFSTSDFRIGRSSGKAVLAAAQPLLDEDGTVQMVLLAGLDLKWVGELIREAAEAPGTTVTVFDAEGTILIREPDPSGLIGKRLMDHPIANAVFQKDRGVLEDEGLDGQPTIIGFAALDETGGRIAISASRDLVLDEVNRRTLWGIAILAGVVGTIVVGIWFLLDLLVLRGLRDLQQSASALSEGRIDSAGKGAVPGLRAREIGNTAQAVHDMGAALQNMANKDQLTGLANRRHLESKVRDLHNSPLGGPGTLALLCIDLDGFKPVNDRHGHHVGDAVLVEVARRLLQCVRGKDDVIRLGGDEFLVCLSLALVDRAMPMEIASRIIDSLSVPMRLDGGRSGSDAASGWRSGRSTMRISTRRCAMPTKPSIWPSRTDAAGSSRISRWSPVAFRPVPVPMLQPI
ncbi:GGDEF domain-containing protein [Azospirillum sp. YIM B02556]|uniref:GGDEF domain-containing protein n=1 Tax=Azospirillum endophyticum TaxID=2800326 RepID=A0ABS1F1S2_9PROT|nr:sensor domain-containing diguanylate cyclase [Azospirillum endophyticum]MBK1837319.1 GGDEF domain-containing protein [Azospirillum endophyticum]